LRLLKNQGGRHAEFCAKGASASGGVSASKTLQNNKILNVPSALQNDECNFSEASISVLKEERDAIYDEGCVQIYSLLLYTLSRREDHIVAV
jgi:hypothetical protein